MQSLSPSESPIPPALPRAEGLRVQVLPAGAPAPERASMRQLLMQRLPAAARVLQVGVDAALAEAYRAGHPAAHWSVFDPAAAAAMPDGEHDLIVIGDTLFAHPAPLALLRALGAAAAPDATLFVAAPNAAQWSLMQRLVETDFGEVVGDAAPQRHSPSSLYKLLLDAGWQPHLAGTLPAEPPTPAVLAAAMAVADAAGVPRATAQRILGTSQLLIEARRGFAAVAPAAGPARFTVVVPTTRRNQLDANVLPSPGLTEVGARIVTCEAAANPAEALAAALPQVETDWVLFCHQDIYFPSDFGARLDALLATVPVAERNRTLIGFAGIAVNATADGVAPAGFVIDRQHRFDHAASDRALSIDELAIVVSRDTIHRIDPQIGWHLWATELCLASICTHQVFPRIVRLPLFHNSLNDYQLPQAFHDAARYLAAKYPAFGPIHTLCGVIGAAPTTTAVPAPAPATPAVAVERPERLAVRLDAVCAAVDAALQTGDPDRAMRQIVAGVHQHYRLPEAAHHALYYPELDRRIGQLAERLERLGKVAKKPGKPRGQLLIATELYPLGGHSRVLEDISRELVKPTIVLTDLFGTYQNDPKQLDWVGERYSHADLVVLPPGSAWEKSVMLRRYVAALNPETIVHFGHHQDPIPYVGTLRGGAPRQVFMHHGDHNPSLGATLKGLRHVDLSDGVRDLCAAHLGKRPDVLPLYVEDLGIKANAPDAADSVASSGHPAKYARTGPVSLAAIVRATLGTVAGCHHHIGPLDADWVAEIRAELRSQGIAPERFVHHGWVPSVWERLKQIDAALYVASAPLGGGRVAIEAQGCGYPVLYFENAAHTALPANHPLYASSSLKWRSTGELQAVLRTALAEREALGATARAHYDASYSRTPFRAALKRIVGL